MWLLLLIDKKFYGKKLADIFHEAIVAQGYANASLVTLSEGEEHQHYVVSLACYAKQVEAVAAATMIEDELGEAVVLMKSVEVVK